MKSFTLKTQNLILSSRKQLIKSLYELFLKDDENWHFFYEMEMGDILRVSDEFVDDVSNWLSDAEVDYTIEEWVETIPVVEANKSYFGAVFHMNSEFIVESDDDQINSITHNLIMLIDRYSHSLHNYLTLFRDSSDEKKSPMEFEADTLSKASLNRSFYDGIRWQYLRQKAYSGSLKKVEDGNKDL